MHSIGDVESWLESNLAGCVPEWGFNVRKLMTRSVILGAATALALVGGGVADAAAPVSGAKYDFKNWDTCQLDKFTTPIPAWVPV